MTMFLIQSLLWLLAAFFLGYGLGRWLKGVFCKRRAVETQAKLETDTSHLRVPVTTAAVAAGTAATAALARSREPVKPTVNVSEPELKAPVATAQASELKATVTPLKAEIELPNANLKASTVNVTPPTVDVKAPEIDLPKLDGNLPIVERPKVEINLPKMDVQTPEVNRTLPELDADLSKAEVKAPLLELPKVDIDASEVTLPKSGLDAPKLDVDLPQTDLSLPQVEVELPRSDLPKAEVDAPAVNLPKVEVTTPKLDLDLPQIDLSLPKADVELPTIDLPAVDVSVPQVDLSLPKADVELPTIDLPAVDVSVPQVDLDLPQVEVNLPKADLNLPQVDVDAPVINLPKVEVNSPELEAPKLEVKEIATGIVGLGAAALGVAATKIEAPDGELDLTVTELVTRPEADRELKALHLETTVSDADIALAEELADLPQPVDEADLIEAGKTLSDDGQGTVVLEPVDLNVAHAAVPVPQFAGVETETPTHTTVQNLAPTGLTLATAGAATVAAVQANLHSGVQPMMVDESDAIEAIKLAWDGELSPAELVNLEHTLILRPGETGRLGLVTCSVLGANCVSLGGLEADLNVGDAMRSKLFNLAVAHHDDGNYVFSSLAKGLPAWSKSGDFSEQVDEQTTSVLPVPSSSDTDTLRMNPQRLLEKTHHQGSSKLVSQLWDSDSAYDGSVLGNAEGLVLKPGLYGKLGSIHCGVTKPGHIVVSGDVSPLAEGEGILFHLYNIAAWRDDDDNYRFVEASTQAAQDAILPVTKSMTTDMLEPELAWPEDKLGTKVRRLIEESHDRRGSKLVSQLWDSDSGYDCSVIEGEESLILKSGLYGKLGSVHCGVTKPGRVVVSSDVSPLAEGEGVLFHLYNIVVCRDAEDNYRFERLKDFV